MWKVDFLRGNVLGMKKWLLLILAILCEVTGSLSLKAATDDPRWYVLVAVGFLVAFTALSLSLREDMALGVAYGIWGATGVALTAIMSHLLYNEPLTPVMIGGIACIICGVLLIELGSQRATKAREEV